MSAELALYPREVAEWALDYPSLIDRLRVAFVEASAGRAASPPRNAASLPHQGAYLGAMPVSLPALRVLGAKLVSVFPGNAASGLPTHHAVFVAFDPATGAPRALLDAEVITERRTAAASALATDLLARPEAEVLAILGTGVQARAHARALAGIRRWSDIRVWGRRPEAAAALVRELSSEDAFVAVRVSVAGSPTDAVADADVVCFATHAAEPLVPAGAFPPGCHVVSVGVNPAGPEVDPALVRTSRVAVELRSAAFAEPPGGAPDLRIALERGWLFPDDAAELGELLTGARSGRRSSQDVTYYRSVGVAVEDAAAASLVIERAAPAGSVRL
ncbi:Delta(1)-pyrroline-2-carboxylate reductase [bacterium HR29]|nr:Delta(1)-pyrroline-2-carboxylate reductase [bacterium HR29]